MKGVEICKLINTQHTIFHTKSTNILIPNFCIYTFRNWGNMYSKFCKNKILKWRIIICIWFLRNTVFEELTKLFPKYACREVNYMLPLLMENCNYRYNETLAQSVSNNTSICSSATLILFYKYWENLKSFIKYSKL